MNIQTGASSVRISFMGTTGSNTLQLSQPLRIPFNQETNKKKKGSCLTDNDFRCGVLQDV